VVGQLLHDSERQADLAPARPGIGRPDDQLALQLVDRLGHVDGAGAEVDAGAAQLPDAKPAAKPAVGADEHQRPVGRVDLVARWAISAGLR
jgi:hypothetical protein